MSLTLQKTEKTILTPDDILDFISDYEAKIVPELNKLWEYYRGRNVKILGRKVVDANNPDNRIVVSYGRKIVNTWTGYGARPKYITYKPVIKTDEIPVEEMANEELKENKNPIEKQYIEELHNIFGVNNEPIRTNRAWRNIAVFGVSYELMYIDSVNEPLNKELPMKAVPKFFTVDPREMILLYDYSPEPKLKIAIRFYKMDSDSRYKVEVYYNDHIDTYFRIRKDENKTAKWELKIDKLGLPNYFDQIPVSPFYNGDEAQSIFEGGVLSLIDAYDTLYSDSMNEFDRFAFAYLVMKKFGITNPVDKKDPVKQNESLKNVKRRRVFEHLDKEADIHFLTKDIPTQFLQWMGIALREQIHIQSHVPDFTGDKMAGASGIAIQRLMFDFENLVSSSEADFDLGLYKRIELITVILKKLNRPNGTSDMVNISHKRNIPLNTMEFAQTALTMANAGFSRRAVIGVMPEDIIPDVEKELEYEKIEQEAMVGQYNMEAPIEDEEILEEENLEKE